MSFNGELNQMQSKVKFTAEYSILFWTGKPIYLHDEWIKTTHPIDIARNPSMQVIAFGILVFSYGNSFLPFV